MKIEITKAPNLLTNGFVKTSSSDGSLGVDTTSYLPLGGGTLTGNLLFTDNTLDIGASGATRPRTGYFGTSIVVGVDSSVLGKVKLFGNTSGDVTIQPNAIAGTGIVLTLPATTGTLVTGGGTASGTNTGDQTITNTSDATTHTVTMSASGGSLQLVEGSNITLTTTGTGSAGIVTIASTASGSGFALPYAWFIS